MRVVILCNRSLSSFDQAVLRSIEIKPELNIVGFLINTRQKPLAWKRIKREWRKGRGAYVIIQIIQSLKARLAKNHSIGAGNYAEAKGFAILQSPSLYTSEVLEWIRSLNPDVLLLRGFGIIKEPVLSIAPYGVLSYHHADIKKYRGGPPVFWELFNHEQHVGITLQVLDEGLDTGTIVLQQFVPVEKNDSWVSLRHRVYRASEGLAAEALLRLLKTGPVRNPIGALGKLYTLPNFRQWFILLLKLFYRKFF